MIRGRISGRDRAGLIDAAIIATGLGLLSWTFLMKPIAADIGYAVLNLVSSYEGGLVDAGWLLSYAIWGTAALHPSMRSLSEVAPDRALYEAKHAGRDRIIVASEPPPTNVQPSTVPRPADATGHTDDVPSDAVSDAP